MPYAPTNWVDGVTPTNAANLNNMETGIDSAHDAVDALDARLDAEEAQPNVPAVVEGQWLKGVGGALVFDAIDIAEVTGLQAALDAKLAQTIFDAKGDLIGASAADTPIRIGPVGAAGTALVANPALAAGMGWGLPAFQGVRVNNTAAVAIPTSAVTPISWVNEDFDTEGGFAPGAPTRLTITRAGKYLVVGGYRWVDDTAGTVRACIIRANGFGGVTADFKAPGGGGRSAHSVNVLRAFAVNDYLELCGFHDKGSDLNIGVVSEFFFALQYLGA